MNLPTKQECEKLFIDYRASPQVRSHSKKVQKVAIFLARMLKEAGEEVNLDLVDKASLLHDLFKMFTVDDPFKFNTPDPEDVLFWKEQRAKMKSEHHEDMFEEIFKGKYPELSNVVAKHRYGAIENPGLESWEEKIVYYADKRVYLDQIVSLKERFEDGHKRYKHKVNYNQVDTDKIDKMAFVLEKEIFNKIGLKPNEIKEILEAETDGDE